MAIREQAGFDHAAFEEAYRRRIGRGAGDDVAHGYAATEMPPTAPSLLPRRTDEKAFDHAAFERSRPRQHGYDLFQMRGFTAGDGGFVPVNQGGGGAYYSDVGAAEFTQGFDSYGSTYSDLRSAYQPDMAHLKVAPVERTLDELLAERAQLRPRVKPQED